MAGKNGSAPLTKEALADRSKFVFREEDLELPEIGGKIVLKQLSVAERDELPDLTDDEGKADVSIPKLAAIFAAAVDVPKVTQEEALEFLPEWPAAALDKVIEKFGEISGEEKEKKAAAATFPADG